MGKVQKVHWHIVNSLVMITLASSEALLGNCTKTNEMIILVVCLSLLLFINVKHEGGEEVAFLFCS